jgi:hypothetical protein
MNQWIANLNMSSFPRATLQRHYSRGSEEIVQFADVMVRTWKTLHQSWKEDEPERTIVLRLFLASLAKRRSIIPRPADDSGVDQNALSEDLQKAQFQWDRVFTRHVPERLKKQIIPLFPLDSDDSV